jgi:pimeloyl-ACP methyl ester carboxylesterase
MAPLNYFELGTPSGLPLVFLHGFPSAAHQVLATPDLAIFARFRLIAVDRPGFGGSAPSQDATDLGERFGGLLQNLGIGTFHLLSVSGGTRTAFELADQMRDRVSSLAAVSSLGSLDTRALFQALPTIVRALFATAHYAPWLLVKFFERRLAQSARGKRAQPAYLEKILSLRDKEILRDPHVLDILEESYQRAFKQGALAIVGEAQRMRQKWRIDDWRFPFPVRIYHGSADLLVPPIHSQWLHDRSAGSTLRLFPGEGHYSLPIARLSDILAEIR